jgi:hypothetical protein
MGDIGEGKTTDRVGREWVVNNCEMSVEEGMWTLRIGGTVAE